MFDRFSTSDKGDASGVPTKISKSEATRGRIPDAAARTFRRHGYAGTRLKAIAEVARMQAGCIYYHFDSKQQIPDEVLDIGIGRVFDAVVRAVDALPADAGHRRRLRTAIEAHLVSLLRHGDYTSAHMRIFDQIPPQVRRRQVRRRDAYGAYWAGLLEAARDAGAIHGQADLGLVRMFLLGAMNWSVEWYRPGARNVGEMADTVFAILFDGIGEGVHR